MVFQIPARSPAALRRRSLGRRKDCKAYVEFHHREEFLRVTPISLYRADFISRRTPGLSRLGDQSVTWRTKRDEERGGAGARHTFSPRVWCGVPGD